MDEDGPHASKTYGDRFGTWNKALEKAGLETGTNDPTGAPPISREDLLNELRRLADELGKTPTTREMDEEGAYCEDPYRREFGTWNNAVREADLEPNVRMDIPKEEVLQDLKDFAEELGHVPTSVEMSERGPHSRKLYARKFGSWNNALQAAGFDIHVSRDLSREDLVEEIRRLAEELGRVPLRKDMTEQGAYCSTVYYHEFGPWPESLLAAGLEPHYDHDVSRDELIQELQRLAESLGRAPFHDDIHEQAKYSLHWYQKTFGSINQALRIAVPDYYGRRLWRNHLNAHLPWGSGWREIREKAIQRDNEQCLRCGMSRKEHKEQTGFDLNVHHRRPRQYYYYHEEKSLDEANKLENLLTLCFACHRTLENSPVQPLPPQKVS